MTMIPFDPIKPVRTIDTVADRLEERIIDGTFPRGAKLPSESQLAAQLHDGRRTVREALKVLETKGLVEVKMGVGAIVRRNDLDSFLRVLARNINTYLSIDRADIIQVMELRWLLERAALQRLMANPDESKLRPLLDIVAQQRQAHQDGDAQRYQEWHFRFHQEVIAALQNSVISMIYRQVLALVRAPMEQSGSDPVIRQQSIDDHEIMVEALRLGAADDLEAALQRHLAGFIDHISATKTGAESHILSPS
jgi:GntR family transcriptional repressor for pyruvate dehydrogenase complex